MLLGCALSGRLDGLREVLRGSLSEVDVKKWFRLIRGLAIFVVAVILASYTTDFVLKNKINMYFALSGFESLPPDLPDFGMIVMSRTVQSLILLFLIVAVASIMALIRGHDWKFVSLLTLVFHSFIIVAAFTLLQIPFIAQVPQTPFAVVSATMRNVTFYNADMTGLVPQQGQVHVCSDVVKASYVYVFRAYSNLTQPRWGFLSAADLKKALNDTVTYMNMSDVMWVSGGGEVHVDRLDLSTGSWSKVSYEAIVNRSPVRVSDVVTFQERMISVLSMLSMLGVVAYNSLGFKKLYNTSLKYSLITGVVMLLTVLFLGMF